MNRGGGAREAVRTLAWLAAAAAGIFAARAAGLSPGLVEWLYSRRLYPVIVWVVGAPARSVSWSLTQLLLLLAAIAISNWLVIGTVRSFRRRSMRRGLGPPSRIAATAAILVWTFQVLWGLNHARPPLARALRLAPVDATPERLTRLADRLAEETNWAYRLAREARQLDPPVAAPQGSGGPDIASAIRTDAQVVVDRLAAAYDRLLPATRRVPHSDPKMPRALGWLLPRLGISGFYNPYLAEATVAADLPSPSLVFVLAHEMAHQRGVAGEDEANFLAFLACRESGLAVAGYAGALGAYGLAWTALGRAAPDSARAVSRRLGPGPATDRRALRAWWDRRRSRLEPMVSRTNDAYLKASGHRLGVATYGEAVRLLLSWAEGGGFGAEVPPVEALPGEF